MIPLMALMIGCYIMTRMMIFILSKNPDQYKLGIVINKLLAASTIIITMICLILIFLPSVNLSEIENLIKSEELTSFPSIEEDLKSTITKPYIIITKPAEFYKDDFQSVWWRERIPVRTKFKFLGSHLWRSSITDLKIVFYRVKYKEINGWIMEDHCKLIK